MPPTLVFRHVKNHHFLLHTTGGNTIMMSSSIKKRKPVVTPSWSSSPSPYQLPARLLQFETPASSSIPQRTTSGEPAETTTVLLDDEDELFIFSPFGLSCRRIECQPRSQIQMDYRSIQIHLRKHKLDCKGENVRKILESYSSRVAA
jgi:hypothetical protein